MREIEIVLALLVAVATLATIARRVGVPYPILMVVGGIAIGSIPGLPQVQLEPDIVFLLFLPPLLHFAAFFTSTRDLRANVRPIAVLAVGLVIATAAAVAAAARQLIPGLGWAEAFALGAIVAPPDAAAATSVLQRVGAPKRLVTILEGESLLNDATALVLYRLALAAAASGTFSAASAGLDFVLVGAGGIAFGYVVGVAIAALRKRIADTPVSITISLLAPFAAYLPAEQLGVSGVLATVTSGVYLGRHASASLSSETRVTGGAVWQMLVFLLNGVLFTLLGLQLRAIVDRSDLALAAAFAIGIAISAIAIAVRFAWVFGTSYLAPVLARSSGEPDVRSWRPLAVVSWAGMRGAVSLAAAFALPLSFAQRDLVIFVTVCVIAVTLVGQGLSLPYLVRGLGVVARHDLAHDEAHAKLLTADAALARLADMRGRWSGHAELLDRLEGEYQHRATHVQTHHEGTLGAAERERLEHRQIRQELIDAERAAALDLHARGAISDEVLRLLERDLDLVELRTEA